MTGFLRRFINLFLPGIDAEEEDFEGDTPRSIIEDLLEIDAAIACGPSEPATAVDDRSATARRLRELSQGHKQLMHKRVQLPLDAEDPRTICWMEVTS